MLSSIYFTSLFVFTSISLKVSCAGSSHNYPNHLKRHQLQLWNPSVVLYVYTEYGMKSLFIKLDKWNQIKEQILILHVGSGWKSTETDSDCIKTEQIWEERRKKWGYLQRRGNEILMLYTMIGNLRGEESSRRNGTQSPSWWWVRIGHQRMHPAQNYFGSSASIC